MSQTQDLELATSRSEALVLNDSFPNMLHMKTRNGTFPPSFESMIAFMTKHGGARNFYLSGVLTKKPTADLVIAEYPDNLPISGVDYTRSAIPP
ncbi:hypothetical protein KC19_VG243100 [Ceratodon purpureus]|uniref:Uncharacterized protein n=1 Tax=Ceratodon purpureus TaxID=3225 RepID=A0A8T0HTY0_CERPU|nr:hypothetical protein KC19_VG243100 [Ceratodon purpureus]